MKRNIDLTENRFFSNDNNWFIDIAQSVLTVGLITGARIPWNANLKQLHSDKKFGEVEQSQALIIVGDKKTRNHVKKYGQIDNHCDRCGKRLNTNPWLWEPEFELCHSCSMTLEREFGDKCKWRKKEEIRNAIIRSI